MAINIISVLLSNSTSLFSIPGSISKISNKFCILENSWPIELEVSPNCWLIAFNASALFLYIITMQYCTSWWIFFSGLDFDQIDHGVVCKKLFTIIHAPIMIFWNSINEGHRKILSIMHTNGSCIASTYHTYQHVSYLYICCTASAQCMDLFFFYISAILWCIFHTWPNWMHFSKMDTTNDCNEMVICISVIWLPFIVYLL